VADLGTTLDRLARAAVGQPGQANALPARPSRLAAFSTVATT
jgi:hypothetical protein